MKNRMKAICIYHSRDLDGWMSSAIVQKWWDDSGQDAYGDIDFLGYDYGDEIPGLRKYDKVIMCDISFPVENMYNLFLDRDGDDFVWIDHHVSAINRVNEICGDNKGVSIDGLRDVNFSACELTWKYFFPKEKMPEIVRLLGRYDCFGHKGTDEEQDVLEFQYAARAIMKNPDDCLIYLNIEFRDSGEYNDMINQSIADKGSAIYQYLCTEASQIYKKSFPIIFKEPNSKDGDNKERKFLCVNHERFNPINFDINYHHDGYDGFACFWFSNGKWSFSLYNDNGHVDCSSIAKQFGGGGHKGASGFVTNKLPNFLINED